MEPVLQFALGLCPAPDMKILLVTNYQPPHMGGIEFAARSLKACWASSGHSVVWLTSDIPTDGAATAPDNLRVPAWNFLESSLQVNSPLVPPWERAPIRRAVQEADVVNVHSLAPGVTHIALREAIRQRKPLVVTQHVGVIPLRWKILDTLQHGFVTRMARRAQQAGAAITFVGEAVREWFVREAQLNPARVFMTPAGIDQETYREVSSAERASFRAKWHLSDARLNVLFVGRFVDKKGLPLIRELALACPDIRFTLVGGGPIHPSQWNAPNVHCMANVSDTELRELYGAHDLFLMPSFGEGWPAVVPQAMACGLPALISPECFSGFNRDPEKFLICVRDPAPMADVLRRCSAGNIPLLKARPETAAYARATWDWRRTADLYLNLFGARD